MVGATDAAALTCACSTSITNLDVPVDRDYVKSYENRTQMFNCEQSHQQGQKCLYNTNYVQQHQKCLVCNPLVKCNIIIVKCTHTLKQKRDLHEKHHSI